MVENLDQVSIELRNLQIEDYLDLRASMQEAYSDMEDAYWKAHHIQKILELFAEGQFCVLYNDKVVGVALSLIINSKQIKDEHSYEQVTGAYSFNTHTAKGDILYGIELFVHPEYRGLRLGRRLYDTRKELCERLNLKAIRFGGRIPNYKAYANELSPKEYIQKVRLK